MDEWSLRHLDDGNPSEVVKKEQLKTGRSIVVIDSLASQRHQPHISTLIYSLSNIMSGRKFFV